MNRALGHGQRLVAAARTLIVETGDTSFAVQEAARRANVSLTTVYAYFSGKDELLLAVVEEAIADAANELRGILEAQHDPIERLRMACVGSLLLATGPSAPEDAPILTRETQRLAHIFPDEAHAAIGPLIEAIAIELDRAKQRSLIALIDPNRDATTIYYLWVSHLLALWRLGDEADREATADYLWEFLSHALRVRRPPARIAPGKRRTSTSARKGKRRVI